MTKINLQRLSYVVYEHSDTEAFEKFSEDFGFSRVPGTFDNGDILFQGYGPDPYVYKARPTTAAAGAKHNFLCAGFIARTQADFDEATKLNGARVSDISHLPGGGSRVDITDCNGYEVQIVFGQEDKHVPSTGVSRVYGGQPHANGAIEKHRKGVFNRMSKGPAMINKLGHFGYLTDNYKGTCEWYTSRFNFKATDVVHVVDDPSAEFITFFHLDLGQEFSDHHSLLVAQREQKGTAIHHASFEVEDLDTQMMGHQWLADKGHELVWGVGRHVMGSQIFDYWKDPSGFIIEHYADGDLVNEDHPTSRVGGLDAAIWGPPLPNAWH